ncbi:La-related protein 1B [Linum perenne]
MENSGSSNQQVSSPQSRRTGKTAVVSSPWNQIVRGESESNSVEPPSLSPPAVSSPPVVSDQVVGSGSSSSTTDDEISNGNAGKRQVWNVPSNGAVEVGPVMGAVSWPALSESARVSSKSSPADGSSSVPVSVYILFVIRFCFDVQMLATDGHMQPQRVSPRFMRHQPPPPPPPASTPFLTAPPVRPFGSPMPFAELPSPMYYVAAPPPQSLRGMPFVAAPMPPHAVFFPTPDFQLHSKIVTQIDYYFSNENLIRDTFLRQNMDEQGWVPIKLIAGFKKVSLLTDNVQLILDALRASIVVEVQGDKVRRRNDWMRWLMPQSVQFPSISSPRGIVANVQNMSLEEKIINQSSFMRSQVEAQSEAFPSRSSSGEISGHPQQSSSGEGTSQ